MLASQQRERAGNHGESNARVHGGFAHEKGQVLLGGKNKKNIRRNHQLHRNYPGHNTTDEKEREVLGGQNQSNLIQIKKRGEVIIVKNIKR